MRRFLIIGTVLLFIGFLSLYIFKGCTGFVSSSDGERKSKMMPLTGSYYYNKVDKKIWQKEEATDSYKTISSASVDSLMWDASQIIGYAQQQYFVVSLKTNEYRILKDRSGIKKVISKDYQQLQEVPPLSFN